MATSPYLGEIMLWPASVAPRNWAFCDGSLLTVQQNSALFSLLGTTYGGDGRTNFALPDLRGRVPRGANQATERIGTQAGAETVPTAPQSAQQAVPGGQSVDFSALEVGEAALNVTQPHLGLNYVIALRGLFPSRN